MTHTYDPVNLSKVRTYPLSKRKSKVRSDHFATPWKKGNSFVNFMNSLPNILAGSDIRAVISAVATAFRTQKTVILAMGAHVIKVGLNPVIIDLMERGIIKAVAMNGAGIIHDFEIAMTGQTSEDVETAVKDGSFGMARETGSFLSKAIKKGGRKSLGLGEAVGQSFLENKLPFTDKSILATGARLNIPVTVHIAIGTDIIHNHPDFDAKEAGGASHKDYRIFASMVALLEGGVYLNVGSAVVLPEVFLKAVTLVRNLGTRLENFTAVNMDFIHQYRSLTNVIGRPVTGGGKGFNLVGHHEIMIPLIAAGVIEELKNEE